MKWVVYFSISSRFGPRRGRRGVSERPRSWRRRHEHHSAQVATLTITGGAKPGSYSQKQHRDWEVSVLKIQMALEDNFRDIAEKCSLPEGRHAVLLMDRGTMDVLASGSE
jgi:hypothetical protein